jgi:diguanylate cyclase (GGDEF)-like protein/PAS domain S-box-containing protein
VVRAALDCIIVMDERGRVAELNPAAEETFGHPREAALGRPLTELIVPADRRPAAEAAIAQRLAGDDGRPRGHREEMVACRADGSELPIELTVTRTELHGRPLLIANVRDLSEVHQARREREDARRRSRTLVGQIAAAAPVGLVAMDLDGRVTFARGRSLEELGLLDPRLAGVTVYDVEPGLPGVVDGFERARAGGRASTRLDVGGRVLDVSWQPVLDASGAVEAVSAVAVDVTERTRGEERVAHLAYHDHVTGLPNRRKLAEALDQALATARGITGSGLALLWLDIDAFKAVNDGLGHAAGDELLRGIAVRLAGVVGDAGLLARHGGDEFVVLLGGCGADAQARAQAVAGRLLDVLGHPFEIHGTELEVGGSIGIAVCQDATTAADDLLARADAAMYRAKRAGGRSCALWSPEGADSYGRLTLPARLRRAIAEDRLLLHYQPIVSAATGATPAFEALVRWRDTDGTLIPPGVFIAAAESSGVIVELGAWVADAVCAQLRRWRDAGLHAAVSINASPRELAREDFAPRLAETVARHGVEPAQLMVEVTESALMGQPERVDGVLAALRELGVRIGIDDFGADHSSLNRLRSLPVDALKIDRAFLQDVPEDPRATALVRAIVGLGQALGMVVVAEGVERAAQKDVLREAGCDYFQGFYFSRPVPAEEAAALLRTASTVSASTPSSVESAAARASSAGG